MKKRLIFLLSIVLVSLLGISSRIYSNELPYFFAEYTGDTCWAIAAYFVARLILIELSLLRSAIIAFGLSVAVELSQLYHSPWIDSIRSTVIGGLILGFGFKWSDFICYFIGILFGLGIEVLIINRIR